MISKLKSYEEGGDGFIHQENVLQIKDENLFVLRENVKLGGIIEKMEDEKEKARVSGCLVDNEHVEERDLLEDKIKEKDNRHNKLISEHANLSKKVKKLETELKEQVIRTKEE